MSRRFIIGRDCDNRVRMLHPNALKLGHLKSRIKMRVGNRYDLDPDSLQCFPDSLFVKTRPGRAAIVERYCDAIVARAQSLDFSVGEQ